jgi:hypothetical protein
MNVSPKQEEADIIMEAAVAKALRGRPSLLTKTQSDALYEEVLEQSKHGTLVTRRELRFMVKFLILLLYILLLSIFI